MTEDRRVGTMTQKIFVALADGFEEIEAVAPIDILRRAGFDVLTVGLPARTVTGAHGISLTADRLWDDVSNKTPDVLVLPGGMPGSKNLGEHVGLKAMAQRVASSNGYLAALCAAPAFALAAWGLLAGRKATCYPGCEAQFPVDAGHSTDAVVVDDRIITGKGPGAAAEFAFAVVEQLSGAEAAASLRAQMQFSLDSEL